jgi:site-specific DNA-methyltransferase (adenine-specific)
VKQVLAPYYQDDSCTIYHGDCRDILQGFTGRPFDLTVTDPKYNAGLDYGPLVDDNLSRDSYVEWCREWWTECRRVSKAVVVFPGHGNLDVWFQIARPSAIGCWYKPGNPSGSVLGWCEWEPWLYWAGDKALVGGSDVLRAPAGKQREAQGHPCPKPILLMRRLLAKFSRCQTIIDPFMGSGSTLRAAKDLGRTAVGIDINERYCEIAANRLAQEVLAL